MNKEQLTDKHNELDSPKSLERIVVHSNAISESSYTLSLNEQRVLIMAISMIKKGEAISGKTPFSIKVKEYAEVFNVDLKNAYNELIQAERNLFNRVVWIYEPDTLENLEFTKTRWIQAVTYKKGQGEIVLYFSEKVIPYISDLESSELTVAYLSEMSGLTSVYAIRLYAMLAQWRSVGRFKISVDEFRMRLELSSTGYNQISNLKNKVVEVALRQINERTSLVAHCEYLKTGRTITHLVFTFSDGRQLVGWEKSQKAKQNEPVAHQDLQKVKIETLNKTVSYEEFTKMPAVRKKAMLERFVNDANLPTFYRFAFSRKGLDVLEDDSFKQAFSTWLEIPA